MKMRDIINLIENANVEHLLHGDFYHGTARSNIPFDPRHTAYFTQSFEDARDCAYTDLETREMEGIPKVLRVRLAVSKLAFIDCIEMQDLHFLDERVAELKAAGYDAATSHDSVKPDLIGEICVFGAPIKVVEVIELPAEPENGEPYRSGWWINEPYKARPT